MSEQRSGMVSVTPVSSEWKPVDREPVLFIQMQCIEVYYPSERCVNMRDRARDRENYIHLTVIFRTLCYCITSGVGHDVVMFNSGPTQTPYFHRQSLPDSVYCCVSRTETG